MQDSMIADKARQNLVHALRAVADGDQASLRRVYDLTSAKLFGICLRISGNREAAEDILQDVYVKVSTRAAGFDPARSSPITWLATIARNASIDWRRSQRRNDWLSDDMVETVADEAPLADKIIEREQTVARIFICLDALDERQSRVIRAAFFEGLTYNELSTRLVIPLGTIKSSARRGMQKLKECIGDL